MQKKAYLRWLLFVATFAITASYQACGPNQVDTSYLTVQMPSKSQKTEKLSVSSAVSSMWAGDLQAHAAGDINCYGIMIGGPESNLQSESCQLSDGGEMRFGVSAVGLAAGARSSLSVSSGLDRQIYLVGWKAHSSQSCEKLANGEVVDGDLSVPYLLAQLKTDLSPGQNSIDLKGRFADAKTITGCNIFELIENTRIDTFDVDTSEGLENPKKPSAPVTVVINGGDGLISIADNHGGVLNASVGEHEWPSEFTAGAEIELSVFNHDYGIQCQPGPAITYDPVGENVVEINCQRLIAKGVVSSSFGGAGVVRMDRGGAEFSAKIGLDEQKRAVVWFDSMYSAVACRFFQDGQMDDTLNAGECLESEMQEPGGGHQTGDPFGLVDAPASSNFVEVGLDLFLLNTDYDFFAGTSSITVTKYLMQEMLDENFGNQGVVRFDQTAQDAGMAMALDTMGNIVVVGSVSSNSGDLLVYRLKPDGTPDTSFGNNGQLVIDQVGGPNQLGIDKAESLAILEDGSLLIVGQTSNDQNTDIFMIRVD